jgi:hypothetical protein
LLLVPALLPAQIVSCALSPGAVADTGSAAIPRARVSLTSKTNGFLHTVTSNNEGYFLFPDLKPGGFTLSVEARSEGSRAGENVARPGCKHQQRPIGHAIVDP